MKGFRNAFIAVLLLWDNRCLAFTIPSRIKTTTTIGNHADNDDVISPLPATTEPVESATARPSERAMEICNVLFGKFLKPVVLSLMNEGIPDNWNSFWARTNGGGTITNAQRLSKAIEELGPTYVKFAQAVSSRPDIVPKPLCDALSVLQDDMEPFSSDKAKNIIRFELQNKSTIMFANDSEKLDTFLQSLSSEPVAAASVGQVFSGSLPMYGRVAVKVQRPGIRRIVERDEKLLRSVATWIESLPAISFPGKAKRLDDPMVDPSNNRLIATELVSSVDEFMSRLFEELDYHNEAANMEKFASLYSIRRGTAKQGTKVVVPEVLLDLCTENVIVMEWIDGTKLTNVVNEDGDGRSADPKIVAENLALVELCIDCTLSQLLDTGMNGCVCVCVCFIAVSVVLRVFVCSTHRFSQEAACSMFSAGVLHADPHGGNLLKVKHSFTGGHDPYIDKRNKRRRIQRRWQRLKSTFSNSREVPQLGYLDFGMLSEVDPSVQDALVCAIVLLVFARDVDRVAQLFGELQLLPDEVVDNPSEMRALAQSLDKMFDEILIYPDAENAYDDETTLIPSLRFDKLLDALTRLVPRFQFDLPPYFLNNARALSTLEGIARSLDPSFSVLQVVYPYALNRLLRNPSGSQVVDDTLQTLVRSKETGRIDRSKVEQILDDAALITGFKRRKVMRDIFQTRGGLRLMRMMAQEGLGNLLLRTGQRKRSRRNGKNRF